MRLVFPDFNKANWRTHGHFLTDKNHLLIYNDPGTSGETWTELHIREYRLLRSITLMREIQFTPPAGQKIAAVDFSPSGTNIAWSCSASDGRSLWVSHVDGSSPIEIGHIPKGPLNISDMAWLPDRKHLSFVYNGTLYTVPIRLPGM